MDNGVSVCRVEPQFSRWTNYASILEHMELPRFDVPTLLGSELGLYDDGEIALFYAPFDYVETTARLAIVGVTPGPTQAIAAIECAREGLKRGDEQLAIQRAVKRQASFKGMRGDLAAWFDASRPDRSARPGSGR